MRQIIYDVAVTLDGYIARDDGSFDGFAADGPHVDDYLQRLEGYGTVLMGRKTYEAGYAYGLQPGQRAYPHMEHYIVSQSLEIDGSGIQILDRRVIETIQDLRSEPGADIYLCGGGELAALLLEHDLIDQLVLKVNPVCFGSGIRLFGYSLRRLELELLDSTVYDNGVICSQYEVQGSE